MTVKIQEERKQTIRLIRKPIIKKITADAESVSGETGHTHDNKDSLDKLTVDSQNRLLISGSLVDPLLRQEDW